MTESKIVEAVGVVSGRSGNRDVNASKQLEAAMQQAVKDAMEDGIPLDSDEMRERILSARQQTADGLRQASVEQSEE